MNNRDYSLFSIACPTRLFAEFLKKRNILNDYCDILIWNYFFILLTIAMSFYVSHLDLNINGQEKYWILPLFFAISRIMELLFAFYFDAFSKSASSGEIGSISRVERVKLLTIAYFEIIIQFGIIYYSIIRLYQDEFSCKIKHIFDAIYFSAITITTTGFGDIAPSGSLSKAAVIVETLTGLLFIAGALAVYLSRTEET